MGEAGGLMGLGEDTPHSSLPQPDEDTMRKILGELYGDRQYLQKLQTELRESSRLPRPAGISIPHLLKTHPQLVDHLLAIIGGSCRKKFNLWQLPPVIVSLYHWPLPFLTIFIRAGEGVGSSR